MPREGLWGLLPNVDGQTTFSIVVGLIATIATFWIGYRKTIGARDERLRAADQELCSSVIKRIAVERQAIDAAQFLALRRAKSIRAQVPVRRLIGFHDALSITLLETVDNNFLDAPSKNSILELIAKSRSEGVSGHDLDLVQGPAGQKAKPGLRLGATGHREATSTVVFLIGFMSVVVGAIVSLVTSAPTFSGVASWLRSHPEMIPVIALVPTGVMVSIAVGILSRRQSRGPKRRYIDGGTFSNRDTT